MEIFKSTHFTHFIIVGGKVFSRHKSLKFAQLALKQLAKKQDISNAKIIAKRELEKSVERP